MNRSVSRPVCLVLMLSLILLLPNCVPMRWLKEKLGIAGEVEKPATNQKTYTNHSDIDDGSPVIAFIQGKPLITEKSLNQEFDDFFSKNPELQQFIAYMPHAKEKFLEGLIKQKLIDKFITEKELDKSAEYQKDLQDFMKAGQQMINARHFIKHYKTDVSDAEAEEFYNKHRAELPEALLSNGGTRTLAIQFNTKDEAQEFLNKVSPEPQNFESIARSHDLNDKIQDFKLVHAQSESVSPIIRSHILRITKTPHVGLVSDQNTFWVIAATEKEEAQYKSFEAIAPLIKRYAENQKSKSIFEEETDKLKESYQVTINTDYFKKNQSSDQNAQDVLSALLQSQQDMQERESTPPAKSTHIA